MNLAKFSAKRPKVSESTWGRRTICRRVSIGTSRRGPRSRIEGRSRGSFLSLSLSFLGLSTTGTAVGVRDRHQRLAVARGVAPVLRQQVVEQVVDRYRADEPAVVVGDRRRDEVVRREVPGHVLERRGRTERLDVGVQD